MFDKVTQPGGVFCQGGQVTSALLTQERSIPLTPNQEISKYHIGGKKTRGRGAIALICDHVHF